VLGAAQTPPKTGAGAAPGDRSSPRGPEPGPGLPGGPEPGAANPALPLDVRGSPARGAGLGQLARLSHALARLSASLGGVLKMKGLRSPPDKPYLEKEVLCEVKLGVCC